METNKEQELSFNEKVVENLKKEIENLNSSLENCRKSENFSMYKNLINGYRDVVRLIQDLDWRFRHSEYGFKLENSNFIDAISIWEQNGDIQIRNQKIFGRIDLDKIIFNKGDKILFENKRYQAICVDNEYAIFAEINDSKAIIMDNTIVFDNKNNIANIKYQRLN